MAKERIFPVDTVVRFKDGRFALIKNVATLLDGSLLHYEGEIEGKPKGNYYISPHEIELEAWPIGYDPDSETNP
jgi:hypothetical protein